MKDSSVQGRMYKGEGKGFFLLRYLSKIPRYGAYRIKELPDGQHDNIDYQQTDHNGKEMTIFYCLKTNTTRTM